MMKHTATFFLSFLLATALHTHAGAQIPAKIVPAVERAAQAARKVVAQSSRRAVAPAAPAVYPQLLTLSNAGRALEFATRQVSLLQKANLLQQVLPSDQSPTLATAIYAQDILKEAVTSKEGKPYRKQLLAVEDGLEYGPLDDYEEPPYNLTAQELYPSQVAQGSVSEEDLMDYILERNNKFYIYLMFKHAPAVRRAISQNLSAIKRDIQAYTSFTPKNPLVWAIKQIPANTDTLFLAEQHIDAVPERLPSALDALQKKANGREILVLTEFVSKGYQVQLPGDESPIRRYNARPLPLWQALEQRNIPVIGLEPDFAKGKVGENERRTNHSFWGGGDFTGLWSTAEGMRIRNQHWLELYQKVRAEHPNALIVIYAGYGHVSYIEPFSLANAIPGNTFVIQMLATWCTAPSDDFVAPLKIPRCIKWSSPEVSRAVGFDVQIKL